MYTSCSSVWCHCGYISALGMCSSVKTAIVHINIMYAISRHQQSLFMLLETYFCLYILVMFDQLKASFMMIVEYRNFNVNFFITYIFEFS